MSNLWQIANCEPQYSTEFVILIITTQGYYKCAAPVSEISTSMASRETSSVL